MQTQLIIDDVPYPATGIDQYRAERRHAGKTFTMISGRTVTEISYKKWHIEYSCEFLDYETYLHAVRNITLGNPLSVQFLTPESDTLMTDTFVLDGEFSGHWGDADWRTVTFKLQGVNPIA